MPVTNGNVIEVFTYHPPTPEQMWKYNNIRQGAQDFATIILSNTPQCADQQAALRLLREAVMTANASIALKGLI